MEVAFLADAVLWNWPVFLSVFIRFFSGWMVGMFQRLSYARSDRIQVDQRQASSNERLSAPLRRAESFYAWGYHSPASSSLRCVE